MKKYTFVCESCKKELKVTNNRTEAMRIMRHNGYYHVCGHLVCSAECERAVFT